MKLETVSIDDVYPDPNNPRKKFEDIESLAASFDLNEERPGEPFTPPILVRDGGIFRIVDGERRYRAMKLNRKKSFAANVCEDLDEVNAIMAMMATDDKQPLTDIEKSRGVQQMLLLGVEPTKVDKATKGKGRAKRVNHAMILVDDAAEDMTLDRLLAIDEFSDDPEVVDALTKCKESEWEGIANRARRQIETKKHLQEIRDALIERGYSIVDERPDDYSYYGAIFSLTSVEKLTDAPDTTVFYLDTNTNSYDKYCKITKEPEKEAKEAAERKLRDELRESDERVEVWFGSHLNNPSSIPTIAQRALDAFIERNETYIERFQDDLQIDLTCEPCKYVLAVGYSYMRTSVSNLVYGFYSRGLSEWNLDDVEEYLHFIDDARADGYKPEEWELDNLDELEEAVKGTKAGDQ